MMKYSTNIDSIPRMADGSQETWGSRGVDLKKISWPVCRLYSIDLSKPSSKFHWTLRGEKGMIGQMPEDHLGVNRNAPMSLFFARLTVLIKQNGFPFQLEKRWKCNLF